MRSFYNYFFSSSSASTGGSTYDPGEETKISLPYNTTATTTPTTTTTNSATATTSSTTTGATNGIKRTKQKNGTHYQPNTDAITGRSVNPISESTSLLGQSQQQRSHPTQFIIEEEEQYSDDFQSSRQEDEGMVSGMEDDDEDYEVEDTSNRPHEQQIAGGQRHSLWGRWGKPPKSKNGTGTMSLQSPTVQEFFFPIHNPTIQRYYRFTSTAFTPIAALHKRPTLGQAGVTGLLRRSAVVPSHGTDQTGQWILVSVGGRSGWARKQGSTSDFATFTPADSFVAHEAWMGNHAFVWGGRIMLGSDAPSLLFSNGLIVVGALYHFLVLLPRLQQCNIHVWLLANGQVMFTLSFALTGLSLIFLWLTAVVDPGIIPPFPSPIRPAVPTEGIMGGPNGYRYCSTCNIFRPPRSKHCNSCNVCVSVFDHRKYNRYRCF